MHVPYLVTLLLMQQLGVTGVTPASVSANVDTQQVSRFITQLGSSDFKERQAATQALDALGSTALDALHKASQAPDPEVRRRAETLTRTIEKRVETAQLLEPKQVRLVYEDTPIAEAVRELARKTGFSIQLADDSSELSRRKITLDTGETTFWQAFDQLCEKAGLMERLPAVVTTQTTTWQARAGQGGRGAQVIVPAIQYQNPYGNSDTLLTLVPGKDKASPPYHVGAVRMRALPPRNSSLGQAPAAGETLFVLEVSPQPKMGWHNIETRIDRAIDENDQCLGPVPPSAEALQQVATALANGAVIWDSQSGRPTLSGIRQMPVRLKLAEKPARMLKEVEGAVLAQVQTPPKLLFSVDNILKAGGQTIKTADGKQAKILDIKNQADGNITIRVRLEDPVALPGVVGFNRRGIMRVNGVVVRRGGMMGGETQAADASFTLLDAKGRSFHQEGRSDGITANGNTLCWDVELTYRPHEGQGEPAKLLYSDRRWVVIEVPFTLKDVPLW